MKKQLLFVFALLTCGAINAQVYLTENFNAAGTAMPDGWSFTAADATSDGWSRNTSASLSSQAMTFPDNGSKILGTNDDACDCNKSADRLIFPSVNLSSATNPFLVYDQYFQNRAWEGAQESAKVQVSTNGGSTWTDYVALSANTVNDWETKYICLGDFVGQSNVKISILYNDGGGWTFGCGIDNVEIVEAPTTKNVEVSAFAAGPWSVPFDGILANTPVEVGREVVFGFALTNTGGATINSFDLVVTGGGNTYTQSYTLQNLLWNETRVIYLNETASVTTTSTTYSGYITNINGGEDDNASDNDGGPSAAVLGITLHPDKAVFIEEATGTWCQWCPRGTVMMHHMEEYYPNNFVGVAVHNSDPMTVDYYDTWIGPLIPGYPSCLIDRDGSDYDPLEMEQQLIQKCQEAPAVVVGVSHSISGNTLTVDVSATYNENLSGDYRFNVVLIEDHVYSNTIGASGEWGQVNAYSGGGNGNMGPFDEAGGLVFPITYDHVGRALLGGTLGTESSLPASGMAGQTYTYQFTTTVDPTWQLGYLYPAAFVLNATSGEVLNVKKSSSAVSVNETPTLENSLVVYPNPSNGIINIQSNMLNVRQAEVRVFAATGELVLNRQINDIRERNVLDVSEFGSGIYTIVVDSEGQSVSRRVTVIK
jgi:hypothetical protein